MIPAGFESANLGSSGEYDNHGTTGVDNNKAVNMQFQDAIFKTIKL